MTTPGPLESITWGSGDRRLLIVHGLGSNAAGWWRVGPALAAAGFHVTAVDLLARAGYAVLNLDLRGHGGSHRPGDYSIAGYAADLLALHGRWEVVLGHSLGGAAVVQALGQRPDWTDRVILEDPMLVILDEDFAVQWVTEDFGPEVTVDMVIEANPNWHPEDSRIKLEAQNRAGRTVLQDSILHNPGWNIVAAVAGLQLPTLLLGADPEKDPLVPPALGESLAQMNPNIEFRSIPNGSHSMHRDEFDAFMTAALEFAG